MSQQLIESKSLIQILIGPRQCGKSTLFAMISEKDLKKFHEISFDDLQYRELANRDPALFLEQFNPPLLLDEAQYVPNLFPELKKRIDELKRKRLHNSKLLGSQILFRLTGSNQILMDKNVSESLAGRASYFYLNTLSVHEILNAYPDIAIKDILFKGGWPELYIDKDLSVVSYLNDYIRSYLERDIVLCAGIQKLSEFHTVIKLLGARTAQETRYTEISNNSGVSSVTVKEWTHLLERSDLIYLLKPYYNNLNKRLIKSPKLYFLDTGLAVRLQGWQEATPLLSSPQIGALFETLVLAEILKFIRNQGKDWELFFWRNKQGEEVDFVIRTATETYAFEAKLSLQRLTKPIHYPPSFKKEFNIKNPLMVITYGGEKIKLSEECCVLPIANLYDYLAEL